MKRLYLETNFVIGRAFEQYTVDPAILTTAQNVGAEIALPAICLLESLQTVQRYRITTKQFGDAIQKKLQELREDQSPTSVKLKISLNSAVLENGILADERDARIQAVVQSLSNARLFEIDHQTATKALLAPIIARGVADNLILYAILDDATTTPASDMAFFTLNVSDFAGAAAVASLQGADIALLKDSQSALMWLRT